MATAADRKQIWESVQAKTFTQWANYHLSKKNLQIENIQEGLRDGVKLIRLVEILYGKKVEGKVMDPPKNKMFMIQNCNLAMKFLKQEGLPLYGVAGSDFVEGNITLILGMNWILARDAQIKAVKGLLGPQAAQFAITSALAKSRGTFSRTNIFDESDHADVGATTNVGTPSSSNASSSASTTGRGNLSKTEGNSDADQDKQVRILLTSWIRSRTLIDVPDLTSLREPRVLSALIQSFDDGTPEMDILDEENLNRFSPQDKIKNILQFAEEKLHIPQLIDAETLFEGKADPKALVLYTSLLANYFSEREEQKRIMLEEVEKKSQQEKDAYLKKEQARKNLEMEARKSRKEERLKKIDAEKYEREKKEREEKERIARVEKERIEKEEREKLEKEQAEKREREERIRIEREKREKEERERIEKEEKEARERFEREEQERIQREQEERERIEKEEREERERLERERVERLVREERERVEREERERLEREEEERLQREQEERERLEREERERLERERQEREEREEIERQAREEREAIEKEEREAREKLEREEREERERIEREEQERRDQIERDRLEQEEQERQDKEEEERIEREEKERTERLARERQERERLERAEHERMEREEKERLEKLERERLDRLEKERLRREKEEKERQERERIAKEERERIEKERKERVERERKEKLEREKKEREEKERLVKEEMERKAKEEKLKKEKEEKERKERQEREMREREERERKDRLEKARIEKERREREEQERLVREEKERVERLERERIEREEKEKTDKRRRFEEERSRRQIKAREQYEEVERERKKQREEMAEREVEKSRITEHVKMVDMKEYADIHITTEKVIIGVHSFVLEIRCPFLANKKKQPPMKKGDTKKPTPLIELGNVPSRPLLTMLHYIYSGKVFFDKLGIRHILDLEKLASDFKLERLVRQCQDFLQENLDDENVIQVLKGAEDNAQNFVKEICFHHIVPEHWTAFVTNKEGIKILGMTLFQEVIDFHQKHMDGKLKPLIIPPKPKNTIIADFQKIYEDMPHPDLTVRVGDQFVDCHKSILAARSPQLSELVRFQTYTAKSMGKDNEHIILPIVRSKNRCISSEAFTYMLKYIYYLETDIPPLLACELIAFSADCGLEKLQLVCEEIVQDHITLESALTALNATYMPQVANHTDFVEWLKPSAINFILDNLADIDFTRINNFENPDLAVQIIEACKQERQALEASDWEFVSM